MSQSRADQFELALNGAVNSGKVDVQVAPLVETARSISALADTPPPPYGLSPGRQRFLTEAATLRENKTHRTREKNPMIIFMKLGAAAIVTILVMGLGLGGGQATAGSLPGDPLYGLKLAAEQLQMAFALDAQEQADLSLAAAESRMWEVTTLLQQGFGVDDNTAARVRLQLETALQTAARMSDDEAPGNLERLEYTLRQHERSMSAAAGEQPEAPVDQLLRQMERLRLEAHSGQEDPQGLRTRLREGTPSDPPEAPDHAGTPGPHDNSDAGESDPQGPKAPLAAPQATPVRNGPHPAERPDHADGPDADTGPSRTQERQGPPDDRDPGPHPPEEPKGPPEDTGDNQKNEQWKHGQQSEDTGSDEAGNDDAGNPSPSDNPNGGSDAADDQGPEGGESGAQPPSQGGEPGGDQQQGGEGAGSGADTPPGDGGNDGGGDQPSDQSGGGDSDNGQSGGGDSSSGDGGQSSGGGDGGSSNGGGGNGK